ncbi:MAG: hypothetical protein CMA64_06180 [Euryarchaeota archaeon]|nr:hypothetical protein [Euryarchaeota archaeon]
MPAVTRIGDDDVAHCSPMTRAVGSGNVYVNNKPVSRQSDPNTAHAGPGCVTHNDVITAGSGTVKVNDLGCGRIGDDVGGLNCTSVAAGSPDVFAGG